MDDTRLLAAARLTPADVANQSFRHVKFGGLDPGEVDAFLDRVQDELALWEQELAEAHHEIEVMTARQAHTPAHGFVPPAAPEVQGVHILQRAQQNADQIIKDAQSYAREAAADGQRRRAEILEEARGRANALVRSTLEEATRQAAEIISQAPIDAQALVAKMQSLGVSLEAQLRAFTSSLVASLDAWDNQRQQSLAQLAEGNGHTAAVPA
jgi:DivIVA domain-containing protein